MESPTQTIEQLQKRHADLNKRKIQAETQRDSAKKQLDDLKADAVRKYGTDDIAKLKEQLNGITIANEQKRAQYQAQLDSIDVKLKVVERMFTEGDGT